MATTFRARSWSIEVPSPWKAQDLDECVEVTQPEGSGALHISAVRKVAVVTDPDLRDFAADDLPSGTSVDRVSVGEFTGVTAEYVDSRASRFWRKWWLRAGSLMVYATYNCSQGDEDIEKADVEAILTSLAHRQI